MKETEQIKFWKGEFGEEYTIRNSEDCNELCKKNFGVTRTELNKEFLFDISKDVRILEIGCNRANQLKVLKKDGFTNLWGIEINGGSL